MTIQQQQTLEQQNNVDMINFLQSCADIMTVDMLKETITQLINDNFDNDLLQVLCDIESTLK